MPAHYQPRADGEVIKPDRPFVSEIPKLRKIAATLGLTGLANDTKWNELLSAMRGVSDNDWSPSFRCKCIDADNISQWDGEWQYDLPLPFISVRWMDLTFLESIHRGRLLNPDVVDHSTELEAILTAIGFDFEKGAETFRIFGYAPRDRSQFEQTKNAEQDVDPNA